MAEKAPKNTEERYKILKKSIEKHSFLYHTKDSPEISDEAYDSLVREFKEIEKKYPSLKTKD